MTEEEAKTKDCIGPLGCGRFDDPLKADRRRLCIASECLAWRWHPEIDMGSEPDPWPDTGYCGLAGKG